MSLSTEVTTLDVVVSEAQRSHDVPPPAPAKRARWESLAPLLLYLVLALAIWGPWVLNDPNGRILAANDIDAGAYLWFFSWWPHALLHGLNPLQTDLIFAPEGYNLAWTTCMPGPSILLAPLTLAFGPVITWNFVSLASPVLSAWTAFLLCRHVTSGAIAASVVGGYLFGFSPYMLGHLVGAPQLAFVALVPVAVLLVLCHVDRTLPDRRFVLALAATLLAEFLISLEVLATMVLFGVLTLGLAIGLFKERRSALLRTGQLATVAAALATVLASPMLFFAFARPHARPEHALISAPADLLSFVVPTYWSAISRSHAQAEVPVWATGFSYVGIPLLVLVALFLWHHRPIRVARLAVGAFGVAVVASLGRSLEVAGTDTGVPLPWALAAELPLLRYAIPVRFMAFAFLAAAVIVALWLAWRPSVGRWLLTAATLAVVAPAVGNASWHTELSDRPFFSRDGYQAHLSRTDRVLMIPAWGSNLRWQAEAGFSFRVVGGYVGAFPESYMRYPIWAALLGGPLPAHPKAELRRLVRDKAATAIIVDPPQAPRWQPLVEALGVRAVRTGGVLLYRLAAAPPR
jgi:hypothetical protein